MLTGLTSRLDLVVKVITRNTSHDHTTTLDDAIVQQHMTSHTETAPIRYIPTASVNDVMRPRDRARYHVLQNRRQSCFAAVPEDSSVSTERDSESLDRNNEMTHARKQRRSSNAGLDCLGLTNSNYFEVTKPGAVQCDCE